MTVSADLPGGERGEVMGLEGERMLVVSPRAFAPGAPLRLVLHLPDGELAVEGRTVGSRRRPDQAFDVRLRLVNVKRADRERLAALLT